MKTLTKSEFLKNKDLYVKEIKKGKIFIYPTDTIYGIGCHALNGESIKRIRKLKKRDKKPFSIIVNKKWIKDNCDIEEKYLNMLPGPYTFIVKLKNKKSIAKQELVGDVNTIGIRIPDNWFTKFLNEFNLIFVTTSVNISGEPPLKDIKDLKLSVDYVVDDGILNNKPSKIFNLVNNEIIERA